MYESFAKQKRQFYSKVLPILAVVMLCFGGSLEIMYRVFHINEMTLQTSIFNLVVFILLAVMAVLVRWFYRVVWFVCPILTTICYFYVAFAEYNGSGASIYYTMVVGLTMTYFILVAFNEQWIVSTLVFIPEFTFYMWKTGKDITRATEITELSIRVIFCVILYAVAAYIIEKNAKQAFMGRENDEKAFYRWLKIFETFPEGLALVKNNTIMYANKALPSMFDLSTYDSSSDPYNAKLQQVLLKTNV